MPIVSVDFMVMGVIVGLHERLVVRLINGRLRFSRVLCLNCFVRGQSHAFLGASKCRYARCGGQVSGHRLLSTVRFIDVQGQTRRASREVIVS